MSSIYQNTLRSHSGSIQTTGAVQLPKVETNMMASSIGVAGACRLDFRQGESHFTDADVANIVGRCGRFGRGSSMWNLGFRGASSIR